MMSRFLCCLFLLGGVYIGHSQNFTGGVFAGAVTSQVNGDGLAGFDMAGFQAGAFTTYAITERTRIQLGLGFVQKGAREPISDTSSNYRLRANYINLPLTLQYRINDLVFEVGPALDILVNANESDISGPRDLEGEAALRTFVLVGVAGVGYHFSERWFINFRSTISATPARTATSPENNPYLLQAGGPGQRNLTLNAGLYYTFGN